MCLSCSALASEGLKTLESETLSPHIVGTAGHDFRSLSPHFAASSADMRQDVQEIFKATPHDKQVMMFSATLSDTMRPVCKRFMDNVSHSIGASAA